MSQNEKLVELLEGFTIPICGALVLKLPEIERLADYLIDNGVVLPPCKVGDTVYQTDGVKVYESTIKNIIYETKSVAFDKMAIGKSIFLSREEVEQALKGAAK